MTAALEYDPDQVPARPAATVMLVRDGATGLEVFMLRRTDAAVFAAGMYVFPGGKVDAADATGEMEALCAGHDDRRASAVLEIPSGGLPYWVAAIRECFEEAGVLLARHADGDASYVSFGDDDTAARFSAYRTQVQRGELSLTELCRREQLVLATDAMSYVAHWITPVGPPRRFSARFFVALAPSSQEPLHDDYETVDSLWVRPAEAVARYDAGELGMFPPTLACVQFLARHARAADAVAAGTTTAGEPPVVVPKVRVDVEGEVVEKLLPGHPDYEHALDYDPSLPRR